MYIYTNPPTPWGLVCESLLFLSPKILSPPWAKHFKLTGAGLGSRPHLPTSGWSTSRPLPTSGRSVPAPCQLPGGPAPAPCQLPGGPGGQNFSPKFVFRRRKMKCRGSSETRFPKVSRRSEPFSAVFGRSSAAPKKKAFDRGGRVGPP